MHGIGAKPPPRQCFFWLGFWFWLGHLGAALAHFFASLAVVGAWGDHLPSGVVGGGPRVTRRPVLAVRAYVSPGPLWRTYVLVGRLPAVPAVPYFGDVLGDCPPPGPALFLDAGTAGTPFIATSQSNPGKMKPIRNLLRPLRGEVAAYVRGTGLIRGFSLAAPSDF